jgi:hypothetical protein
VPRRQADLADDEIELLCAELDEDGSGSVSLEEVQCAHARARRSESRAGMRTRRRRMPARTGVARS